MEAQLLQWKQVTSLPAWWAKPQGTSGTSLVGTSAAWTQWKHSSWSESKSLHINMMSQATRNLWNQTGWKYSTCKCSLPKRKQLQRQPSKKKKNWMDGWGFSNRGGTCFYLWGGHHSSGVAFLSSQKYPFQWYFNKKTISWEMFFFKDQHLYFIWWDYWASWQASTGISFKPWVAMSMSAC